MAKKIKLKDSKKDKWFLYKIRDRNYNPTYKLDIHEQKGIETLLLTDQINSWSEGVNSSGLMIVSAALNNHLDFEDNGQMSDRKSAKKRGQSSSKGLIDAMKSKSIESAVKILKKERFVGTTFISNGDDLVILEIYVNDDAYEREALKIGEDKLSKLTKTEQIILVMNGIKDSDYDIAEHKVEKDRIAVRTNHSRILDNAGYSPEDEDPKGYTSSMHRWKISKDAVENLGEDVHPFQILTTLKNLKGINKEPQNNPIRIKTPKKNGIQPYYTTTIVMLTSTGILFAVPIEDDIKQDSKLRLKNNRKVDFVLLPKNLPLFEGFTGLLYKDLI